MALDPSISLQVGQGVPQLDLIGSMAKAQNLLTSQQALKNAQMAEQTAKAQLPGIEAEALEKEREERARKFLESNKSTFSRINSKTGAREYDFAGAATELANAGFQDYAQSFYTKHLANESAKIANTGANIKNADSAKNYYDNIATQSKTAAQFAANLTKDMPADKAASVISTFRNGALKNAQTLSAPLGEEATAAVQDLTNNEFDTLFGTATPGQVAKATISPAQQVTNTFTAQGLAQSAESIAQAGAGAGTDAASRDPNSQSSQSARKAALAAGADPAIVGNLSRAQLMANPMIAGILEKSTLGASERVGLIEQAANVRAEKSILDEGIKAINSGNYKSRYGKPGSVVASQWNRLITQDANLAKLQAAIDQYNTKNNTSISVSSDGLDAVLARIGGTSAALGQIAASREKAAKSPTIGQATGTTPTQAPSAVRMVTPDGIVRNIPKDRLDDFKKQFPNAKAMER